MSCAGLSRRQKPTVMRSRPANARTRHPGFPHRYSMPPATSLGRSRSAARRCACHRRSARLGSTCLSAMPSKSPAQSAAAFRTEPAEEPLRHCLDLRLGRHRLGPHPLLLNLLGEAVGVLDALDVTPRAGIPVEQPCPADVLGHLDDMRLDA